jgi:DNA-binding NarL/FixJ family response regulator
MSLNNKPLLTTREEEVMKLVRMGLPNKGIAAELNISAETVKKHLKNIFEKLQARNKIEALNKIESRQDS